MLKSAAQMSHLCRAAVLAAAALACSPSTWAQTPYAPITSALNQILPARNNCSGASGLACAMPELYGSYGLVLPNSNYSARFDSSFEATLSALNTAIGTQMTLLPLASPASGFVYSFDAQTGVYKRSASTFGPILTERAETIGKGKLYLGATFQRFRFSTIDGYPLHDWPAVFTHVPGTGPNGAAEPYESQFISTSNSLDLKVNQYTFFATYGLTNKIDVSVAVPLVQVGLNLFSTATINRTVDTEPALVNGALQPCCSNGPPYANYFDPQNPAGSLTAVFSNSQYSPDIYTNPTKTNNLYWSPARNNAAGIGDVVLRFKGNVYKGERVAFSLLTDVRLPTGDAMNFLGSGAAGVKPFAALSVRTGPITPHLNFGYQWSGASILAGNVVTGTKADLPGVLIFSAGTDIGITHWLTGAVDYIGNELVNAPRVGVSTFTSTAPLVSTGTTGTFPTIVPGGKDTYNQSSFAVGLKASVVDRLLVSGNLLFALNDGGLRQTVVPLIGLSYTF